MRDGLPSLLLFARAPVEGRVKTRLVPPLTPPGALRLYRAFLEDAARLYGAPDLWNAVLETEGDPEHADLVRLFAPPWRRQAQAAGDLGHRLAQAFRRAFRGGASGAVAVGSDHPALPRRRIEEAFALLSRKNTASLVPAEDGGYCAIGLLPDAPVEEIFRDVPWSSASAFDVTRTRLDRAGLSVEILEPGYDVDRPDDLARLRRDLSCRDASAEDFPRSTARILAEILP
jgi:uncharacterized protein